MSKSVLEYDMNDPDDKMAFKRAVKSTDMAIVLFEITHNLHRQLPDSKDADAVFDAINKLIKEYGINLNELIA